MKVKVMYMNGGKVDGYYYVGIEGTDLIACSGGHPDFSKNAEKEAKKCADKINEQLKKLKDG